MILVSALKAIRKPNRMQASLAAAAAKSGHSHPIQATGGRRV